MLLGLVAEGLTNPQIANRLFLSPSTHPSPSTSSSSLASSASPPGLGPTRVALELGLV